MRIYQQAALQGWLLRQLQSGAVLLCCLAVRKDRLGLIPGKHGKGQGARLGACLQEMPGDLGSLWPTG